MKIRIILLTALLVLTVAALGVAIYFWIDSRISYSYLESSYDFLKENSNVLIVLLQNDWMGLSQEAVLGKLTDISTQDGSVIVVKQFPQEGMIMVNEVALVFKDDSLVEVKL